MKNANNTDSTNVENDSGKLDNMFQKYIESYSTEINIAKIGGFEFLVHPNVYRGESASTTDAILETFTDTDFTDLSVLDMGCGMGVLGILATLKGASRVVMADINPKAVENAQANIAKFEINDKCKVSVSDLFSSIDDDKFDLILFNMPFIYMAEDAKESSFSLPEEAQVVMPPIESFIDIGYQAIRSFFTVVKDYLNANGIIRCTFASYGNFEELDKILKDNKLTRKTIAVKAEEEYGLESYALEISSI